jgi:hypothetical protein
MQGDMRSKDLILARLHGDDNAISRTAFAPGAYALSGSFLSGSECQGGNLMWFFDLRPDMLGTS